MPPGLPSWCDGCGESFTLQHGLDCPKSGLIIRRHNEIRDCLGDTVVLFWPRLLGDQWYEKVILLQMTLVCVLT